MRSPYRIQRSSRKYEGVNKLTVIKGVLGRHYSLAKYFPWMAEQFKWSSETKFACLSGIAHDPIQRDIFTPLFLAAEIMQVYL